jgi:hypothetical protein
MSTDSADSLGSSRPKTIKKQKLQKSRTTASNSTQSGDYKFLSSSDPQTAENSIVKGTLESDYITIFQTKRGVWRPLCHCGNVITPKFWCTRLFKNLFTIFFLLSFDVSSPILY